jgi:antitoxin HicB
MKFGLTGKYYNIIREDIISRSIGITPKPFDNRNRYYVKLHGKNYPIKQLIHLATNLPYTRYFGAQDAQRILKKLGFDILKLSDRETIEPSRIITQATNGATYKFAITLKQDEDGYIVVSCPALPGCHSQGRTEQEAISNIKEAIRGYIASMKQHGEPIPGIIEIREVEVAA